MINGPPQARKATHEFVSKLAASGKSVDELGNAVLSLAIGSTVELSQGSFSRNLCCVVEFNSGIDS